MSLVLAHQKLGWPTPEEILHPPGAGPRVITELATKKIGQTLQRRADGLGAQIGVLTANPRSDATESPLALVCEFPRRVSQSALTEAHKLAWNFSNSPLLFTVEPGLVRCWTCCEPPHTGETRRKRSAELRSARTELAAISQPVAGVPALHWLNLLYGRLLQEHPQRFRRDRCADRLLLDNLRVVRRRLNEENLDVATSHDLLARLIFVQFLFDRRDSQGQAALNPQMLERLHREGILAQPAQSFEEVLAHYDDTYQLFAWLDRKFNGDLFLAGEGPEVPPSQKWEEEKRKVTPKHLRLLSDFVGGRLEMRSGQSSLWPLYAFDAIPLEFISSIYESFLMEDLADDRREKGAVYTPAHVVDFLLDAALPWNSKEWNVRVLDPACGSGIFLVRAFQRIIHRWRNAHEGQLPSAQLLSDLLSRNFVGIDCNKQAVRTAAFSLYLALCDEIDPKHYWTDVRFPRLRDKRLLARDFFEVQWNGFFQEAEIHSVGYETSFDLVTGNAPWGKNTLTPPAKEWAEERGWPTPYGQIGPLFLPKAAQFLKAGGQVTMLQPAGLLFGKSQEFVRFRKRLFDEFQVFEVVNLSALRFGLFRKAVSPACVLSLSPGQGTSEPIQYICPKPDKTVEDNYRITVESMDIHLVMPEEATGDPLVWYVLRWGSRRDLSFIRKLQHLPSLAKMATAGIIKKRDGIIRGDRKKIVRVIENRRILRTKQFPAQVFLELDAESLPRNLDPRVNGKASTDFSAFEPPQLILKKSWQAEAARFRATLIRSTEGILCSHSYVSIHGPQAILSIACLTYNSLLPIYYLFLTSSRLGTYRPEVLTEELLQVPLPATSTQEPSDISSFDQLDEIIYDLFSFHASEWMLMEDRIRYTFADFSGGTDSPGRQVTGRTPAKESNDDLMLFCETFLQVLRAAFGTGQSVSATIFAEQDSAPHLPVRSVRFQFGGASQNAIRREQFGQDALYEQLSDLTTHAAKSDTEACSTLFRRIFRVYTENESNGRRFPAVYLIRPDQVRYWTRSEALREADEVVADIVAWSRGQQGQFVEDQLLAGLPA